MTDTQKFHLIGKIHSTQGLRGHLFVVFKSDDVPWIQKWKVLWLTSDERASAPDEEYEILRKKEHFKQGKSGWVIELKGIADKTAADTLIKKWIWIPQEFLISKKGEKIFLQEIENFLVVDQSRGEVGPIVGFATNGAQDLIQIQTVQGTYDVPLVQPFIEKIDYEQKKIFMNIPQGLLEDV